jgi:hypothetical protein
MQWSSTKVEYEFRKNSVIFSAGRVIGKFPYPSHKHGFRLTKKRGFLTSLFFCDLLIKRSYYDFIVWVWGFWPAAARKSH